MTLLSISCRNMLYYCPFAHSYLLDLDALGLGPQRLPKGYQTRSSSPYELVNKLQRLLCSPPITNFSEFTISVDVVYIVYERMMACMMLLQRVLLLLWRYYSTGLVIISETIFVDSDLGFPPLLPSCYAHPARIPPAQAESGSRSNISEIFTQKSQ